MTDDGVSRILWKHANAVARGTFGADRCVVAASRHSFVIPGTNIRFGLDALIGLVPGIGDAVTTVMSLYIVNEARALGAPRLLIARMLANVALDGFVGAIPLVGDAFDVVFRANRRNMALLLGHLNGGRPRGMAYRMRASDYR